MSLRLDAEYTWLPNAELAMEQMLMAIADAKKTVRLEMYIFHSGRTADEFRDALIAACQRGATVRVLLDALGSATLPQSFWQKFRACGGEFRWFNPLDLHHIFIRDHRKLLVCDEDLAFIGGFNIATEYRGDGVTLGWRDLGMKIRGSLVGELAEAFDDMFACADMKHKPFSRLRKSKRSKTISAPEAVVLLGGPGRSNPLKGALRQDLEIANEILIVSPYFVPPRKIRRLLMSRARAGAKVQLLLPSKSDLPLMRMAAHSFYRRYLSAGCEIYEYQPQILHAKLFIIDGAAYAGSANMDARSININYELMVRLSNPELVRQARQIYLGILQLSERIEPDRWRGSRTFWPRFKARLAHFLLARMDSFFARLQLRWWHLSLRKVRRARKQPPGEDVP